MSNPPTSYTWPLLEGGGGGGSEPAPPSAADAISRDLFGKDIFFTDDLRVTPKGDWLTVEGMENLRRSILRRLIVRPGEFGLRPNYGVGILSYVKKAMPRSRIDELSQRIKQQLARERRLDKVVFVGVTPKIYGNDTGLEVVVKANVLGRTVRFKPFNFRQES